MSKKTALDDFQTVIPALRTVEAEMRVSLVSGDAASWSTLDEALLYEEWLVNLLHGTLVLPYRRGYGIDPYRASLELGDDGMEYLVVYLVQAALVDVQRV